MDTPLTKFFATVGFKVDTSAWDSTIKKVRSDLTSLRTRTVTVKLKYVGGKTKLPQLTQKVKLLASNKLSLQNVRLTYVNKLKALKPALTQEVKLVYTNRLTTLPSIIQHVNLVYHNRQGGAGNAGGGGSPNPWHIAGGGGLLAGNNVRAFGATIGIAGAANQMYDTGNFQVGLQPQYEFLTGSAEGAKKQIAFVNKLANDLHINLRDVDTTYKQFLGATESSIGMEKSMKTFETIQKFGVMVGATPEALKRGTKAIQQMLSKQKLSAEELTGQLAEASLIPGSTQVFADVLEGTGERGSGSVKKLFANMKDGKYELQDIVRVLDSLQSRINQDQLEKMFDRPAAAMADLQNSMTRFWMAVNEEGGLDLQTTILGGLAKTLNDVTEWIKENKEEIQGWITRIKEVVSVLWEYKEVLLGIYLINKLLMAQRGISLLSWLLTPAALPPAPLAARIKNFLKGALNIVKRAWPVMAAALIVELIDTLQGDATWLGAMTQSDLGIVKWLSRVFVTAGKMIATLGTAMFATLDLLFFSHDLSLFFDTMKMNGQDFAAFMKANFGELVPDVMSVGIERTVQMFSIFFGWLKTNVLASATGLGKLARMDFSGAGEAFGGTVGFTDYVKSQLPQLPPQPQMLPPVQQSLNYRPRANNSATPVVSAPVVNLTVNASGTAEEMAKMASKTVTDMITSTILGSMVNYQHGAA